MKQNVMKYKALNFIDAYLKFTPHLTPLFFEQTPGDNEGQGSLACYSPCVAKSQDTTSRPNTTTTVVQSNQMTILPFQTALKVSKIN